MGNNGWHHVCGDCWYDVSPGDYLPDEPVGWATCDVCDEDGSVYAIRYPGGVIHEGIPTIVTAYHSPDTGPDGICRLPGCGRWRDAHLRS